MITHRKQADKIDKTQGYETVDQTNELSNTKKTSGYKPLYFWGRHTMQNTMQKNGIFHH